MPGADSWQRISIHRIEDLKDAVYGAGLEATQTSRGPLTGSILFATSGDVLYSSGLARARISAN